MKIRLDTRSGLLVGLLGTALLIPLTGCVVEEPRPAAVYVAPAPVEPVFIAEDDYVYYPRYQLYYGARSHRYYSLEGRNWVARPAPRGVSASVLVSAPSVRLGFHDAPSAHHAEIVRTYPRRWRR